MRGMINKSSINIRNSLNLFGLQSFLTYNAMEIGNIKQGKKKKELVFLSREIMFSQKQ